MIRLRKLESRDVEKVAEIYAKFYRDDFPLDTDHSFDSIVAVDSSDRPIGFGWLSYTVEATIILDQDLPKVTRIKALSRIIKYGLDVTSKAGYALVHAFTKDEKFDQVLRKLGFKDVNGKVLVAETPNGKKG